MKKKEEKTADTYFLILAQAAESKTGTKQTSHKKEKKVEAGNHRKLREKKGVLVYVCAFVCVYGIWCMYRFSCVSALSVR